MGCEYAAMHKESGIFSWECIETEDRHRLIGV